MVEQIQIQWCVITIQLFGDHIVVEENEQVILINKYNFKQRTLPMKKVANFWVNDERKEIVVYSRVISKLVCYRFHTFFKEGPQEHNLITTMKTDDVAI